MSLLIGLLALLSFGQEQTGNDLPNLGCTGIFALAVIMKIIVTRRLVACLL